MTQPLHTAWLYKLGLLAALTVGCNDPNAAGAGGTPSGPTAASSSAAAEDIGEVLATVNGMQIGSTEFQEAASRKSPESGDTLSLAEKQEVLDRLIEEKLLYEAALTKGLDRDPKVQKVMINTLLRKDVYASIRNSDFSDEELRAYYEQHKDEFVVPEKVQIKRILIKVNDDRPDADAKAEATRIRKELAADSTRFKELASQFSEDTYKRRGGDVGFVPRTGKPGLDEDVVTKAFEMNVEQLSQPFSTKEGWNVIYVANKRERVERTFQQMKGSVLRKVKTAKLKELYEQYVADLQKTASVNTDAGKLESIEVKAARRAGGPGGPSINPALQGGPTTPGGPFGKGD